jgi:hypothetical protein
MAGGRARKLRAPLHVLWVGVVGEVHSPSESFAAKDLDDLLDPRFGTSDCRPSSVVVKWSDVRGNPIAVFRHAVCDESAGDCVLAATSVNRLELRDVATQSLAVNLAHNRDEVRVRLGIDRNLAETVVLGSNARARSEGVWQSKGDKTHASASDRWRCRVDWSTAANSFPGGAAL